MKPDQDSGAGKQGTAGLRHTPRRSLALMPVSLIIVIGLSVAFANRLVERHRLNVLLIAAVRRNDATAVERLLKQGADGNARDDGGRRVSLWTLLRDRLRGKSASAAPGPTALAIALDWRDNADDFAPDNPPLIKALLDHGADPNTPRLPSGFTPLGLVIFLGRHQTTDLLLSHGAKVDGRDSDGSTPLMVAALVGDPATLEILVRKGANIEATDNSGDTALFHALSDSPACVRALLAHHADRNARNRRGETPLSIARQIARGHADDPAAQALLQTP